MTIAVLSEPMVSNVQENISMSIYTPNILDKKQGAINSGYLIDVWVISKNGELLRTI